MRLSRLLLASVLVLAACGGNPQEAAVRTYITQVEPIVTGLEAQVNQIEQTFSAATGPDAAAIEKMSQSLSQTIASLEAVQPEDPAVAAAHTHLVNAPKLLKEAADMALAAVADPASVTPDFEEKINSKLAESEQENQAFFAAMEPLLPEDVRADWNSDAAAADDTQE